MSWIKIIEYPEATGRLKKLYDRIKGPDNNVDNIMLAHGLRPHTLEGHMVLYKNVLHHSSNELPKWYLETLGVFVSHLNACDYCVQHHFEGLKRLLQNEEQSKAICEGVQSKDLSAALDNKQIAGIKYAEKLSLNPQKLEQKDFEALKFAGFSDGEILEVNQVVSYFNYANRTVLGLGLSTDGDILGLSPNDSSDPKNWKHA